MKKFGSILDIDELIEKGKDIGFIVLGKSAIRKEVKTVWSDEVKRDAKEKEYFEHEITPGMRIKSKSGVAIYSILSVYMLNYHRFLVEETGSQSGAKQMLLAKRMSARAEIEELLAQLNSEEISKLKDTHYKLYCMLKMFSMSLFELSTCVISVSDLIVVSDDNQRRLIEMLENINLIYQRDAGEFRRLVQEPYNVGAEFFNMLESKIAKCFQNVLEIKNAVLLDGQIAISAVKESLRKKIVGLNPNEEFPALVCEMLKREDYYDIVITPDTRDYGCDIWATSNSDVGEIYHMISLKRYTNNICVTEVKDFIQDINKHANVKPHLMATSSFSSNAVEMLIQSDILYTDISGITDRLLNHNIGVSRNHVIDKDFWYTLRGKKKMYRKEMPPKYQQLRLP